MAECRQGIPRIISRRFYVASTSWDNVPVLCTPRNVPTASAAYSAARQPLAGNVAQVQPSVAVGQYEIIQVIAAYGGEGLEFVRDGHRASAQRFRRHHHAVDRASFLELLFPQLFDGLQFVRRRGRVHLSVRKGEHYTGEGNSASLKILAGRVRFRAKMEVLFPGATHRAIDLRRATDRATIFSCASFSEFWSVPRFSLPCITST
jgi:hypothetical protein